MVDDRAVKPPVPQSLDVPHAPVIYFDGAPVFGFYGGIGHVTLEVIRRMPAENGQVAVDRVVSCHLRMGMEAAHHLRAAIDGLILMASPKPEGPAN